jgi:uncharacterized membrane protein YdjX (TVP38/TMEM64 family)
MKFTWSRPTWSTVLKGILLALWVACIFSIYAYMHGHHIPVRAIPGEIRHAALAAGAWGPLILIGAYLAVTVIPFPTAALAIISGTVFGPVKGSLVVLVGVNLASWLSFYLGRFFGRHFVAEHESGWIKKYDELMGERGLFVVMAMRLLFVPFDYVSMGSGMTRITFRQYAIGTLLGTLPHTVTFVVLGGSFTDPRGWVLFAILFLLSGGLAYLAHRSNWAQHHVLKEIKTTKFE